MTILLIVLAWLLCGFVGAYIGHRWAEDEYNDTTMLAVLTMSVLGVLTLAAVILYLLAQIKYKKFFEIVVFKRKS